ncbi:MAG TPA: nucleotidyl transferase AbiEii/AbiGii toxin family protein [Dehalococcoidia bacterium]|nr:nucleotidyl transferase AbiEii/AbiGii toxin family protein [Dehalococcoidia bacterium]
MPTEIAAIHQAFTRDGIPHAFGGAIALAYTGIPRFTHDVDVNIALPQEEFRRVLDSLARLFPIIDRPKAERELRTIAQTRLRWGDLPIDLFFANTPFHEAMAGRVHSVDFMGATIPVISAEDLVVCKALFNRPKDWIDIENIFKVRANLDTEYIRHWLNEFREPDDERLRRMEAFIEH